MKSIQPLNYEIKLYKKNLNQTTLENYKDINFLKKSIEELLFFYDNEKLGKFKPKKIQQRKIGLYQEVEIIDDKYLFINFKYGDEIVKTNNSVVVKDDEITQELEKEGDFLSDFPCGIEFNVNNSDSKFLKIYGKMSILANGNEQMKGKIEEIFKQIYKYEKEDITDDRLAFNVKINIDFHFQKDEIKLINKKVKSVNMIYSVSPKNKIEQGEKGSNRKHARIEVKFSNFLNSGINEEEELEDFINNIDEQIGNFGKLISRTAQIKDNGKTYKSDINNLNDQLVVSLKEAVIANKREISFDEFKKFSIGYFK